MGDKTGIEWTDATWNPVTGCDLTSPGCDNCYAVTMAARLTRMGQANCHKDRDPRTSGPAMYATPILAAHGPQRMGRPGGAFRRSCR